MAIVFLKTVLNMLVFVSEKENVTKKPTGNGNLQTSVTEYNEWEYFPMINQITNPIQIIIIYTVSCSDYISQFGLELEPGFKTVN